MVEFPTAQENRERNEKAWVLAQSVIMENGRLQLESKRHSYQKLTFAERGDYSRNREWAGDMKVYIWRHMSGDVFYVGTGKGDRYKSLLERGDEFYEHLKTKDIELYVPYYNISDKLAFKIERDLIKSFSEAGHPLVNIIHNVHKDKRYTTDGEWRNSKKEYWVIDGVRKSAKEWCEYYGRPRNTVSNRIRFQGMTPFEALTTPNKHEPRNLVPR